MLLEPPSVLGSELSAPLPDGLMRDDDSPLREDFLNISEAQGEPVVQPDAVTDDLRREPIAAISVCIRFHRPSLREPDSS